MQNYIIFMLGFPGRAVRQSETYVTLRSLVNRDKDKGSLKPQVLIPICGLNKRPVDAEKSVSEALKGRPVAIYDVTADPGIVYKKEAEEEGLCSMLVIPYDLSRQRNGRFEDTVEGAQDL